MTSVAKNTFYLTSALVGQKVLSFVYFTFLARFLGVESIGKYTFALAFTTIFSIITDLGLNPVLIREVARAKEKAATYIRTVIGIKIILGVVAYSGVVITAYLLGHPPLTLQLIALAGFVMILDSFHLSFYGILRGQQILKYESIGMVTGQAFTLVFGIGALALKLPLAVFMIALATGSLWNVVFSMFVLRKRRISLKPTLDSKIVKMFVKFAIPFALAGMFVKVYSYIDTVLLQHMKGDIEVGLYSVPYKITYAFQFLPIALSAAIYPALSDKWKTDKENARWIFNRALLYSIIFSLPITFGIAALSPEIMNTIYGSAFINSILPLKISIFGLLFIFMYYPIGALLNATDRQVVNTSFMGATMVINIIVNLMLIPKYGAVGASIAAVCTNVFLFLGTFVWSTTFMRPHAIVFKTFAKAVVAAGGMLLAVLYIKTIIFWPFSIIIGGLVYIALLFGLKAVKTEDILIIKKLFKKEV